MTESSKHPEESTAKKAEDSAVSSENLANNSIADHMSGTLRNVDALALKDRANAVLEHAAISNRLEDISQRDTFDTRPEKRQRSGRSTPLKVQTQSRGQPQSEENDTITTSPNLSKHVIPVAKGAEGTLPAMQPGLPAKEGTITSPQAEKLPSLHQITGQIPDALNAFAEVAAQQDHRAHHFAQPHSRSPVAAYHHGYPVPHSSPPGQYARTARSPTNAVSEHTYGSPPQHSPSAYFANRRTSGAADSAPPLPPSLPSASSSGESQGHASSTSVESYSTAHTDITQSSAGTPRPVLPPLLGLPLLTGFKCDYPECNAPPFQTQYLLSSHRTVHSSTRNHFCPYEGCPRGENGKGFKRKNEMIRHQLVHKSPGYVCPFCPDREHKYPRPDNLQRHVRVHHVDKDRDDPELCEVLAKRSEGNGKARRRRNTAASA